MKWIHHFSAFKVPFYIYKLNKEDCILYQSQISNTQSIIILHGTVLLLKAFTNGETSCIAILNKNNVISIKENKTNIKHYYYKAIAIETTYMMSFQWKDIISEDKVTPIIFTNILQSYQNTLYQYELMNHIITHKYTKHRVVQLILLLCQEFGYIKKKHIVIPFEISQIHISTIIGSNKVTINKIMNNLRNQMLIQYSINKRIMLIDPLALSYIKNRKYK